MLSPSVPWGRKTTKNTTRETESYWAEFDGKRNDLETLAAKALALSSLLVKVSEWNVPFVKEVAQRWTPSFGQVFVTAKVESGFMIQATLGCSETGRRPGL